MSGVCPPPPNSGFAGVNFMERGEERGHSYSFSAFFLVIHQLDNAGTNTFLQLYNPVNFFEKKRHSGGCQYSQDVRVQVPFKIYQHGCHGWLKRRGGSLSWFLRTTLTLMSETVLAFFFPLVTGTLSSFNAG